MKQIFFFICLAALLFSCNQNKQAAKVDAIQYDSSYQPAVFTDAAREEKIKNTFEVVDKIFKDYADSNHLPGLSYGLVVDGKLIYKGNIGYTDIDKKIPVVRVLQPWPF